MRTADSDDRCDITVAVRASDWHHALPGAPGICRRAAFSALAVAGVHDVAVELGVVLGDDDLLARYNRDWREEEGPTNVLSFPLSDLVPGAPLPPAPAPGAPVLLGDVVIALEYTGAEAVRHGIALADHVSHLVVHGVLHLLGHDHDRADRAARMETLEIAALSRLGVANPSARGHAFVP